MATPDASAAGPDVAALLAGDVGTRLTAAAVGSQRPVGLAVAPDGSAAFDGRVGTLDDVRAAESADAPRWVVWSSATAESLVAAGVRVARCWDVAAAHRLLAGGWRADPGRAWALASGLAAADVPDTGPVDLFSHAEHDAGDPEEPVRPDGHLRPDWVEGAWASSPARLARWAALAETAAARQAELLAARGDRAPRTARSESAAELLCVELAADGLPMDRDAAEAVVAASIGPRPRDDAEAAELRAARDDAVLRHLPDGAHFDLRSPGQVKSLLRRVGIEVADTRAWRLEAHRDDHPVVAALLEWRKAERMATTYGYAWLDAGLGADGRLRGGWTGSDGAAGRMTASAGLHNMPADMRAAVVADDGHAFVRADLGQVEPRVLAAVSGDADLAAAARADDLYAPVADALAVDRPTAKVAVLGALYGQTTGHGAQALRRLQSAYPVAMAYLTAADEAGQVGEDVFTWGGRRVRMRRDAGEDRGRAAARGRYARNAVVQGSAAELFKAWAVTVRARAGALGASVVLCLHDELLVHVPVGSAPAAAELVDACLAESAERWAPGSGVRFVSDTAAVERWSDAKG